MRITLIPPQRQIWIGGALILPEVDLILGRINIYMTVARTLSTSQQEFC